SESARRGVDRDRPGNAAHWTSRATWQLGARGGAQAHRPGAHARRAVGGAARGTSRNAFPVAGCARHAFGSRVPTGGGSHPKPAAVQRAGHDSALSKSRAARAGHGWRDDDVTEASELRERLLELLEERYGIGAQGRTPGWLASRLDRAVTALVQGAAARERDVIGFLRTHPAELEQLGELVRVGETRFFRDPEQWSALSGALPKLLPRARLRALSAGCSTGEEAWTLALVLWQAGLRAFRVVGVDRSAAALEVARTGAYPEPCRAQIPVQYLEHFARADGGALSVKPALHPM